MASASPLSSEVQEPQQVFDKVCRRRPSSECPGLGLENTRVEITPRGFITVDAQRRTTEPTIYAIGDVVDARPQSLP
jgi:hypothetical protein